MASPLDFKELQDLASEILGIDTDQVQLDKSFAKDLAADSLDLVELIAAVEDKYDVELTWGSDGVMGSFDATFRAKASKDAPTIAPVTSDRASLIAYVNRPYVDAGELVQRWKEHLRDRLPNYMMPSAFVVLEGFPLT